MRGYLLSLATPSPFRTDAARNATSVAARLEALVEAHSASTWRVLRRLGLSAADADDALQEVLCVVARKADAIAPGSERAFFIGIARRVVSTRRRSERRRPEVLSDPAHFEPSSLDQPGGALRDNPEERLERRQAVEELDRILERMPLEVREVFVFAELERMTSPEIAELLSLPVGTVSTRLRRGRGIFAENVAALQRRESDEEP